MGFLDKLNEAKDKALDAASGIKTQVEQKIAEQDALKAEMNAKCDAIVAEINAGVEAGFNPQDTLLFDDVDNKCAMDFSKDFYEKIVLPGSKSSISNVHMHPYLDPKDISKIAKKVSTFDASDKPLMHIKDIDNQAIVFTTSGLHYKAMVGDNKKYYAQGFIPSEKINTISLDISENCYDVLVNGAKIITLAKSATTGNVDTLAVAEYFRCLKENDFSIEDEEVDKLIHEKIGDKIYADIKKYMTYDDEIILFYAGGLDSLSANDYLACTNKQMIILDREFGGMTADVKQFYYEDITSMQVSQNTNSGDFTVDLLASAITAATKTCDLIITVAGTKDKINTLHTIEAQRVVGIFHEKKKEHKQATTQPQVIVQQAAPQEPQVDVIEQIEKLSKLKDAGILTEEEFSAKKADLLAKL